MKKLLTILTLASATLSHAASPTFGPGGAWGTPTITSGTLALTTINTGTISGGSFIGNGSGLTDMIWSQIGSTPTTLSGYGITDALPLAGGTVTGSVLVDGNTTLGDASGDTVTINAGTVTAPNATDTSDNSIANVGALDDRYVQHSEFAVLASDQSITSTTTDTDVTGLSVTLASSSQYLIEYSCKYSMASTTPGVWNSPKFSGTITQEIFIRTTIPSALAAAFYGSTLGAGLVTGQTSGTFTGRGVITTGTGGVFKITFKQNTSSVDAVTINGGAFILATKIP